MERRVDGDRVTELIPTSEWLAHKGKNGMLGDPEKTVPPRLPRYAERDHLHDVTREHAVFDPANPGLTTYVRVTRRINKDRAAEEALQAERMRQREADLEAEARDAAEKNELLELRSLGIRAAMGAIGDMDRNENDGGRAHTHGKVTKKQAGSLFFM